MENSGPDAFETTVPSSVPPVRLDRYLADHPGLNVTRSRLQKLIVDGLVRVDGKVVSKSHQLRGGELVTVTIPPPPELHLVGEDIPVEIVYEDDHLAVVNKPAGLVTHPAPGNYSGTLVNAMIHYFGRLPEADGRERPGIVHRLDKGTSGLLIVARTEEAYHHLQKAVHDRQINRTYLALVCGHLREESGRIELPIGRSLKDRKKMTVTNVRSREAVTGYHVLDRFRSYDLLEASLVTGRTHQIRVHFSHLGHPIFGDPDYGGRQKWHRGIFAPERRFASQLLEIMDRQALHARRLAFLHPVTNQNIEIESDPPSDFKKLLEVLNREGR